MSRLFVTSEDILVSYKSKIEEALQLLLHIPPQYKSEAWQFWQIVTQTVKLFTQASLDEATPFIPPSDVLTNPQVTAPAPFFPNTKISPIKALPSPRSEGGVKTTKGNKSSQKKNKNEGKKKASKKSPAKKLSVKKKGRKESRKTSSKGSPAKSMTTDNEAEVAAQTLTDTYTTVFTPISTLDFSDLIASNPNSVQSIHLHYEDNNEVTVKPVIRLPQDEQIIAVASVRTVSSQGDGEEDEEGGNEMSDVVSQEILIENEDQRTENANTKQKENKRPKRIRYKKNMRVKRIQTDPDFDPVAKSKIEELKESKKRKRKEEKEKKLKRKSIKKQGFLYEGHSYSKVPDAVLDVVDEEEEGDVELDDEVMVTVPVSAPKKGGRKPRKLKSEPHPTSELFSSPTTRKIRRKRRTKDELKQATYNCPECGITLSSQGAVDVHMRSHTGERPFSCSICGKTFTTKGNLQRHSLYHAGIRPFTCGICNVSFTENKSLKVHMRVHTGERPFECKDCGKTFSQSGPLIAHRKIHEGLKPHLCDICGNKFRQKSNLLLHKKRHHEIKKFRCGQTHCTMTFCSKVELMRHVRSHIKFKEYKCNICNRMFSRFQYLKEHMNHHTGEHPLMCTFCSERFQDHNSVHRHKLKQHADEMDPRPRTLEKVPVESIEKIISQGSKTERQETSCPGKDQDETSTPDNGQLSPDVIQVSPSVNSQMSHPDISPMSASYVSIQVSSPGDIQMSPTDNISQAESIQVSPPSDVQMSPTDNISQTNSIQVFSPGDIQMSPTDNSQISTPGDIQMSSPDDGQTSPPDHSGISPTEDSQVEDIQVSPTEDIQVSPTEDIQVSPSEDIQVSPAEDIQTDDIQVSPTDIQVSLAEDIQTDDIQADDDQVSPPNEEEATVHVILKEWKMCN